MLVGSSGEAMGAVNIAMLKKSQTLAKNMANQLINTLPPTQTAKSANLPGMGGNVDILA